jgi:hypothetical protein
MVIKSIQPTNIPKLKSQNTYFTTIFLQVIGRRMQRANEIVHTHNILKSTQNCHQQIQSNKMKDHKTNSPMGLLYATTSFQPTIMQCSLVV